MNVRNVIIVMGAIMLIVSAVFHYRNFIANRGECDSIIHVGSGDG